MKKVIEIRCRLAESRAMPTSFAPGTVRRIYERDDGMCIYCGASAQQVDHVVPRSKGGPSIIANGVCVCRKCNYQKAGRLDMGMMTRGLFWLSTHGEDTSWVDRLDAPLRPTPLIRQSALPVEEPKQHVTEQPPPNSRQRSPNLMETKQRQREQIRIEIPKGIKEPVVKTKQRRGSRPAAETARNRQLVECRERGFSVDVIAEYYDITAARVYRIIQREAERSRMLT